MTAFLGAALLVLTGWGSGMAAAQRQQERWLQIHTFVRLLTRLRTEIAYRALPAGELLWELEKDGSFSGLGFMGCASLEELPVPDALAPSLQAEIRTGLAALSVLPREEVCRSLDRLAALCEEAAAECLAKANACKTLYPRLGACLGATAAVLLL